VGSGAQGCVYVEVVTRDACDVGATRRQQMPTLGQLVDEYGAQHQGEENTRRTLNERLRYALDGPARDGVGGWRDLRIDRLEPRTIGEWRRKLPERSAWGITKALRQVLNYAVRVKLLDENPASHVPNPEPKRREILSFGSLAELELVGAELPRPRRALPVVVGLTGLRPEEWIALERGDIDGDVLHVRRVFTDGGIRLVGKQERSLRAVPMPAAAVDALAAVPPRLDTRLLFPADHGGYLNLHEWRRDEWTPAVRAAGLAHRSPYALHHTYASFAIAAGVSLFELARFMGTSVEQIDRTYGHLLPDSIDRTRAALNTFLAAQAQAREEVGL
jgi:integrase